MFSVLIGRLLSVFGLVIIARKVYRKKFFIEEATRILTPVQKEYNILIRRYNQGTDDQKKAEENRQMFVEFAYWLRLNKRPPVRSLDIGGRAGLFSFILKSFGHDVLSTDLQEVLNSLPDKDLLELFKVANTSLKIESFRPVQLPNGRKFDLVTGFRTRFHSPDAYWGVEAWEFFLRDLADNVLTEHGEIFFWLNPLEPRGLAESMPEKFKKMFTKNGAIVRQSFVYFPSVKKLRTTK
ncbi:hypothetical protein KKHLCK_15305 [Candidatus Electrothrix laxa]